MTDRPILIWHGGKWRLAPWIISHFPPHAIYVEPYGGAGSVLARKYRAQHEVYNDLDGDLVALYRVLRDEQMAEALCRAVARTPFARAEFVSAHEASPDDIERARRLLIRSHMGFGSSSATRISGFRTKGLRSGALPQHSWVGMPDIIRQYCIRMAGVVVECRPAIEIIVQYDRADALLYLDPPYVPQTRDEGRDYRHEMTVAQHVEMLAAATVSRAMVIISGYPSDLYDQALDGWHRVECEALADGARRRTEVLWVNRSCWNARFGGLFGGVA